MIENTVFLLGLMVLVAYGGSLAAYHLFGEKGLISFQAMALILANIQATKAILLPGFEEPVAMGTIVMMASFFASDLLNETYGPHNARRAIWISLGLYLLFVILTQLTIFIPAVPETESFFHQSHTAMTHLFTVGPALFLASVTAYVISQYLDIWVYRHIRDGSFFKSPQTSGFVSSALGSLVDSFVFSFLAWYVFAAQPLPLTTILQTYVFGTYIIRLILSFFQYGLMWFFLKQD